MVDSYKLQKNDDFKMFGKQLKYYTEVSISKFIEMDIDSSGNTIKISNYKGLKLIIYKKNEVYKIINKVLKYYIKDSISQFIEMKFESLGNRRKGSNYKVLNLLNYKRKKHTKYSINNLSSLLNFR